MRCICWVLSGTLSGMIVSTVNSGSTSVKLGAYDVPQAGAPVRLAQDHRSGAALDEHGIFQAFLASLNAAPQVVAHRVVHGGTRFTRPARINEDMLRELQQLSALAPLHNPKALRWIEVARELCGSNVVHV